MSHSFSLSTQQLTFHHSHQASKVAARAVVECDERDVANLNGDKSIDQQPSELLAVEYHCDKEVGDAVDREM